MRGTFGYGRGRLTAVASAAGCGIAAFSATAIASTYVAMPFHCSIEQGRIRLAPSTERAYRIVGQHNQHPFTACAPGQPDRCRTWMIHRFDMMCGATPVAWASVVAAANDRPPRRVRLENGRIHIAIGPIWRTQSAANRRYPNQSQGVALPSGYAPVVGIAARFSAPEPAGRARVTELPRGRTAQPTEPQAQSQGSPGLQPVSLPLPPIEPTIAGEDAAASQSLETSGSIGDWVTTTERAPSASGGFDALRVIALMSIIVALWLAADRLRKLRPRGMSRAEYKPVDAEGSSGHDAGAALCSELIAKAVNLHREVRERLSRVSDTAIKKLLAEDLAEVQARLLSDRLTELVAAEAWGDVRVTVEGAIAELGRILRRAEASANTEVEASKARQAVPAEPASVGEAFEMLGINPDASTTVVKKIVDGLRQSWHPDHAKDDADRQLREDRMKQINIAWDVISGRRQVA